MLVRWDSSKVSFASPIFFGQSAFLHAYYHYIQVLLHRTFIDILRPTGGSQLPMTTPRFPSLTICTNAARRASQVLTTFWDQGGVSHRNNGDDDDDGWIPLCTEVRIQSFSPGLPIKLILHVLKHIMFSPAIILLIGSWDRGKALNESATREPAELAHCL